MLSHFKHIMGLRHQREPSSRRSYVIHIRKILQGSPNFKVWMCVRLIFHIQCLTCSRWPSALCGEEELACWIMQTDPFISSLGSATGCCEETCFIRYSFRFLAAFFYVYSAGAYIQRNLKWEHLISHQHELEKSWKCVSFKPDTRLLFSSVFCIFKGGISVCSGNLTFTLQSRL